jgi:hypothetical protein
MNKYRKKLLFATQLASVAILTVFIATSAFAQTTATPPAANPSGGGKPLTTVTHDATLVGDGTSGSPLSIAPSPTVSGSLTVAGDIQAKNIVSTNSTVNGALTVNGDIQANAIVGDTVTANGIFAHTVDVQTDDTHITDALTGLGAPFGTGVHGFGGPGFISKGVSVAGGIGVEGIGGSSQFGEGGVGMHAQGGQGLLDGNGGIGAQGEGGSPQRTGFHAGAGVVGTGGTTIFGNGGVGVGAIGGSGTGNDQKGGVGILATAGKGDLGATDGLAGEFDGDVRISGSLVKGSGSFKIDHPLDPGNKYLSHSFVESPDMMNVYNGNITTDSNGDAVVQLPEYFAALNRDFRYQLTAIGTTFTDSIVAEEIRDNHFSIKTSLPNVEVSWQVTGVRQDAYANRNRVSVEENKSDAESGLYLHPEAFDQPVEKSILMSKQPEILRHIAESSRKAARDAVQQH